MAVGDKVQLEDWSFTNGLQYTSYGFWNVNPSGSDSQPIYAGVYAGGKPGVSQTTSMPTTGSATYSGGATGLVVEPGATSSGADGGRFTGASSLTANFTTSAITGSISGITVYTVNNGSGGPTLIGTLNDIGLSATISGAAFNGTADVTGAAGTAFDITGATGKLHGAFYGPSAAEATGVFYLTGGTNNVSVAGSFGAKQTTPSDRRLKIDIEPAGTTDQGLQLYSWRYLGGERRFTGVMAQDLLANSRFAEAVEIAEDGLMAVDYAQIGLSPADFDAMVREGRAALARYRAARAHS
ncbi:MAG: transferrin-binding protein-like solute binding protein [Caulobacteraceae bacterium]